MFRQPDGSTTIRLFRTKPVELQEHLPGANQLASRRSFLNNAFFPSFGSQAHDAPSVNGFNSESPPGNFNFPPTSSLQFEHSESGSSSVGNTETCFCIESQTTYLHRMYELNVQQADVPLDQVLNLTRQAISPPTLPVYFGSFQVNTTGREGEILAMAVETEVQRCIELMEVLNEQSARPQQSQLSQPEIPEPVAHLSSDLKKYFILLKDRLGRDASSP
ncbi:predicted protein [Pyrenophora tritici-repentis Pt-1C-BFP]|uniref:Uncharacterized protein n=1 Tax=Pyrenophora tritici-repentis (strain Pt-1C-BFP) TaxID=426418 RepID=B2WMA7_PYRTR|nr:uncharacterized protein PTRG_11117 [Pyrenophora tritici-repentis Pt-1C-BFP]EDU44167.1 predicted protein [Pyrenophora tritici-repentis Pt-1C-BFP]